MTEQQRIDSTLTKIKAKWFQDDDVTCIFCGHGIFKKGECQLAHLIRRSESLPGYTRFELQTLEANIGPSHFECHTTFDNEPWNAVHLPNIHKVLERIKGINEMYYNRLMGILDPHWPIVDDTPVEIDEGGLLWMEIFTGK